MTTVTLEAPGPRALPVLGNLPGMIGGPLDFFTGLAREYGDLVSFRLGFDPMVLVNHPALIQRVLRERTFERSAHTRNVMRTLLGAGLMSLEGPGHLRARRLMAPAFHRERIRRYVALMAEETYRTLDGWAMERPRDLHDDMVALTFRIVGRTMFSSTDASEAERVDKAFKHVLPWLMPASMLPRLVPFQTRPVPYLRSHERAIAELHGVVMALVRRRRSDGTDHGDLLSMLIAARDEDGSALSDEDVAAQTLTMMLAGHDTTAHTLTWVWYLLTRHRDVQDALAREVRAVVGDAPITFEDLAQMPLVEQVVRETLRLYPPSWWSDRTAQEDVELGGFRLRRGTTVIFSTWVTHRDARFWPEPTRFDPGRFAPGRIDRIEDCTYLPFGTGVHMCIGSAFALTEARLIVAAMAQRFAVRSVSSKPITPVPLFTLGMLEPFRVVHAPRV